VERFDIINAKRNAASNTDGTNGLEPVANGHVSDDPLPSIEKPSTPPSSASPSSTTKRKAIESDGLPDSVASTPNKKRKPEADADAVLAAKLQAEENLRARPTRGGNTRKAAPAKKKKSPSKSKAKTSKKVKAEDDSDIDDSGSEEKKVNRNTGFHVCQNHPLSRLRLIFLETAGTLPCTVRAFRRRNHSRCLFVSRRRLF
jgi:hypothetical protein